MATMEAIGVLARVRPESSPHNAGLLLEDDCTVVLLPPDGDTRAVQYPCGQCAVVFDASYPTDVAVVA